MRRAASGPLVATGRGARLEGLGLEDVGVALRRADRAARAPGENDAPTDRADPREDTAALVGFVDRDDERLRRHGRRTRGAKPDAVGAAPGPAAHPGERTPEHPHEDGALGGRVAEHERPPRPYAQPGVGQRQRRPARCALRPCRALRPP
jgi:hypothetical protein